MRSNRSSKMLLPKQKWLHVDVWIQIWSYLCQFTELTKLRSPKSLIDNSIGSIVPTIITAMQNFNISENCKGLSLVKSLERYINLSCKYLWSYELLFLYSVDTLYWSYEILRVFLKKKTINGFVYYHGNLMGNEFHWPNL